MACNRCNTSFLVVSTPTDMRTSPFLSVPRCLCIRGAQWSPPLTATLKLLANMSATTALSCPSTSTATMPLGLGLEKIATPFTRDSPSNSSCCICAMCWEIWRWFCTYHFAPCPMLTMAGMVRVPLSKLSGRVVGWVTRWLSVPVPPYLMGRGTQCSPKISAPAPIMPWSPLCEPMATISTPFFAISKGRYPTLWAQSTSNKAPCLWQMEEMPDRFCTHPVPLLAWDMHTKVVLSVITFANWSSVTCPLASGSTTSTVQYPFAANWYTGRITLLCSVAEITMWPRRALPMMARFNASVQPLVRATWVGLSLLYSMERIFRTW